MLRFYYNPRFKYSNRKIIDVSKETVFADINIVNIDSPDTINGHIIYTYTYGETFPTYIVNSDNNYRYFVSGITPLSSHKVILSLLRDIISENENWKDEEAYISAGKAIDFNKYKRWNLPFTNTKIKEQRLDINGKSSFFVFYVNQQTKEGTKITESDLEITSSTIPGITGFDYTVNNLNEIPNFNFVNSGDLNVIQDTDQSSMWFTFLNNEKYQGCSYSLINNKLNSRDVFDNTEGTLLISGLLKFSFDNNTNNCKTLTEEAVKNFITNYKDSLGYRIYKPEVDAIDKYVNKIIYNKADGKIYKINKKSSSEYISKYFSPTESESLIAVLRNIDYPVSGPPSISFIPPKHEFQRNFFLYWDGVKNTVNYTIEEIGSATTFSFNFKANTRKLPKSAVRCVNIVSDNNTNDEAIAQALMLAQTNGINEKNDTGRILDIQYLPFSVAKGTTENFKINNINLKAQFLDSDDYEYNIDLPDLKDINKETDTIKLVSPSRASQYLYRPYDNNGNMKFTAKITLKPNLSVIYVRPSTEGLLLADWNDKDCLIIQENFSLTNVTSNWTNYIYNNHNYQNTFNREMQGREFQRGWERRIEEQQAKADEWTSRNISSQKAKTYTGNLPIISNIASSIGSAFKDQTYMQMAQLDREYNEAMYQESLSLAKDNFKMQLENIQSQPNIPSSITTIDVKMLDGIYLEFYSTNTTEKEAIKNFYKYNGNRIDCYGTFNSYYGWFIRGKIIISKYYTQPEVDELNRRLQAGIFTEVEYGI